MVNQVNNGDGSNMKVHAHQGSVTLYPYTASSRDALGCTSPTTKRFLEARGQRPRDFSRAEGNLEVGGDVQPNALLVKAH